VLAVALALASPLAYGQEPKRLSDWLLEQPPSAAPYPLGLSWRVPEEVPGQNALRLQLLNSLAGSDRSVTADPVAAKRLHDWLSTLPATGRVAVALADARWLLANPTRNPILLPGHTAILPQRPRTVTVVTDEGIRCAVAHAERREAKAYLEACDPASAARADWAWIAQPDGRVQRFGIAIWNQEAQDEPAPGAWIWGPSRDTGWPERFSEKLITFLATQGPAPDPLLKSEVGSRKSEVRSNEAEDGKREERGPGGASEGIRLPDLAGIDRAGRAGDDRIIEKEPLSAPSVRSRGLELTTNDWGNVGLLQTPTARMHQAGHFAFTYSLARPYTHGNVFVQPLDWLEAGFRYSDISNRLYGAPEVSGSQSYKDKGFDAKIRLWPESAYLPQVSVGVRDLAGTGLFSGEYLVASKRTGSLDWSLGLGWGYLAGQRQAQVGAQGGNFRFGNYFTGPVAPFGGVQWQTPLDRVMLKLEYDSNDYQNEPLANSFPRSSPWNFGLVYRWGRSTDFTLAYERGERFTFSVALHTQLDGLSVPKLSDPPRIQTVATRPQEPPDWSATARELARQTTWIVESIEQDRRELRVTLEEAEGVYWRDRVDRAVAVLHRDAPVQIDRFVFKYQRRGVEIAEHVVDRQSWLAQQLQPVPPVERRETVIARAPEPAAAGTQLYSGSQPRFEHGFSIGYTYNLGGPDAFLLYQIYAQERALYRFRDDTWLQGTLRLGLAGNYDKFKANAPSGLPKVRTFLREYATTSDVTMPNLQLTHVGKLSENQYYSAYGGYLEDMFAGVGSEWLYRPFGSRVAFGVDVNAVKQRAFAQNFDFLDPAYKTVTGHATLYWDTGWNDVVAKVSVGRYLAKDTGVTLDFSRVFRNGVSVGAFVTKTNVSAAQFGEGSFDKGVYISIPFDAILTRTTNSLASIVWHPLTRDGGAKLAHGPSLYGLTRARSDRTLWTEPAPAPNDNVIPSDRVDAWKPGARSPEPYVRVTARPTADQWQRQSVHEHRMTEALYQQEFRNIKIAYDGSHRLTISLANDRLHPISRAVGRAARTALRLAPDETREIRITFAERTDPVVTYDFFDLARLERYFNGAIKSSELANYVSIEYLNPAAHEKDPLAQLGDMATDAERPSVTDLLPDTRVAGRVMGDFAGAAQTATEVNWLRFVALGASTVLASSALDNRAFRFASDHAGSSWLTNGVRAGNAIPWLALAGSAAVALDGSDPVRSRTGYAATEAGVTALLVTTGLKYGVGRARPDSGLGKSNFDHFSNDKQHQAFPSRHTAVAWAVATPYALEYGTWLPYGIAALTNLSRVGSREHWVSDTVAGSLIGYGIGRIFWESSRSRGKNEPRVMVSPNSITVAKEW
jgi:membrane-associated phospholipid phosphatase